MDGKFIKIELLLSILLAIFLNKEVCCLAFTIKNHLRINSNGIGSRSRHDFSE